LRLWHAAVEESHVGGRVARERRGVPSCASADAVGAGSGGGCGGGAAGMGVVRGGRAGCNTSCAGLGREGDASAR
jgi:hypothetical protein